MAERLVTLPIAVIDVTTLRCTHQTPTALAKVLQITPRVEEDLGAIYLCDWDSRVYRIKTTQCDPLFSKSLQYHALGEIPGVEKTSMLHARVHAILMRIVRAHFQ